MARIVVSAERPADAPAVAVCRYLADMRDHHPHFLPPAFSDYRVESGGAGAGTVTRFKVTAGGRTREYRMRVEEPEPGRVLTESDTGSSLVTTTTVSPRDGASLVQISMAWDGAGGIGGVLERMFVPRVMKGIYADELERLNAYAREQRPGKARPVCVITSASPQRRAVRIVRSAADPDVSVSSGYV
jgi:Polyketide cyclase / dehydrase and lipid transport